MDGDAVNDNHARVENNFTGQNAFHSTIWAYFPSGSMTTDDITIIELYTGGWTSKVASLTIQSGTFLPFIANFNPSTAEYYFSSTPITFDTWIRFELKVDVSAGRAELWQQGGQGSR